MMTRRNGETDQRTKGCEQDAEEVLTFVHASYGTCARQIAVVETLPL